MSRKLVKKDADFGCLMIRFVKDGEFYVASGDFPDGNTLITQGKNEQELKENIIDAVATMWEIPSDRQQLHTKIKEVMKQLAKPFGNEPDVYVRGYDQALSDLSTAIDKIMEEV